MEKLGPAIRLIGASFYIGICIFLGVVGGWWLDKKLETQPVFILLGLVLGMIMAFWGFYQMVIPLIKDNAKPISKRKRR